MLGPNWNQTWELLCRSQWNGLASWRQIWGVSTFPWSRRLQTGEVPRGCMQHTACSTCQLSSASFWHLKITHDWHCATHTFLVTYTEAEVRLFVSTLSTVSQTTKCYCSIQCCGSCVQHAIVADDMANDGSFLAPASFQYPTVFHKFARINIWTFIHYMQ